MMLPAARLVLVKLLGEVRAGGPAQFYAKSSGVLLCTCVRLRCFHRNASMVPETPLCGQSTHVSTNYWHTPRMNAPHVVSCLTNGNEATICLGTNIVNSCLHELLACTRCGCTARRKLSHQRQLSVWEPTRS